MSDHHSRIYWRLSDEFPDLYDDAEALGTYVQLLIAAEQAWPTRQKVPADAKPTVVARLKAAGLVIFTGSRYTIRGLDKERTARVDKARNAASIRWSDASSNASSNAKPMPSRAEHSRAEQSRAGARDDLVDTYYSLTLRSPKKTVLDWLDRLASEHGESTVVAVMGREWTADPDIGTFLGRVETSLLTHQRGEAKAAEERRRAADAEARRREREEIESMPEEQRRANLARLREELRATGLVS